MTNEAQSFATQFLDMFECLVNILEGLVTNEAKSFATQLLDIQGGLVTNEAKGFAARFLDIPEGLVTCRHTGPLAMRRAFNLRSAELTFMIWRMMSKWERARSFERRQSLARRALGQVRPQRRALAPCRLCTSAGTCRLNDHSVSQERPQPRAQAVARSGMVRKFHAGFASAQGTCLS